MRKSEWKRRALDAEARLLVAPPLTFDTLTVCFPDKTVTWRGRVIHAEANCIAFPLTNDENLLSRGGWYPIEPQR